MEKIKSFVKAAVGWLGGIGSSLKKKFPAASEKAQALFDQVAAFCRAKPKTALSLAVVIVCAMIAGTYSRGGGASEVGPEGLVYEVKKGPLTISVVASGTIENKEKVIVRNKIEGAKATILSLIDEGKQVRTGDLLIEFDSGDFKDQELDVQISVGNSSSDVVRASETLAITLNQAQADIEKSELALKFAELALNKYAEGDYPQALQKAKTDITIAEEELRRSEERLAWSEKLSKEEFITRSEYQADELALRKQRIELESAENRLTVLEKYTNPVEEEKLKSDVSQAKLAVDRVRRKAKADILKAEVDLSAREVELGRERDRLAKIKERISFCKVLAPVDGLVVYATSLGGGSRRWSRDEPLAEGQQIEGRRELIHLPTEGAMTVRFDVQEASLTKITKGSPAVVTADALPGRKYAGVVKKIAVLPDTGQSWLNPDLKVYNCEVEIDSVTQGLRPGMSCTVEVLHQQLDNVMFVPIQSVVIVNDKPTVFLKGFGGVRPQNVETGLDNNRMIHIVSGLEEGDEVLLSPPLSEAEKKGERVEKDSASAPAAKPAMQPDGGEKPAVKPDVPEKPAGGEGEVPRRTGGSERRPGGNTPK